MDSFIAPHSLSDSHVLLLAYPAQSHVLALLGFAKLLASKGIAVTYVCAQHRISKLQQDHLHPSSSLGPLIRLVGLPERVPLGDVGIDEGLGSRIRIREVAKHMKDDFVQLLQKQHGDVVAAGRTQAHDFAAPSSVISDGFLHWACDVATKFQLTHYFFFPCPASTLSIMLNLPLLISQGHVPVASSAEPQLVNLPGLPPFWNKDLPDFVRQGHNEDSLHSLPRLKDCASKLIEAETILINTTYEIEANVIDALQFKDGFLQTKRQILTVGPVLPDEILNDLSLLHSLTEKQEHDTDQCLRWLNSKTARSVLYVSFGSIYIPCIEEIHELALGLEASSCAFLWVLRRPPSTSCSSFPVSNLLPEGFQSRLKNRCFIVSPWAPQLRILSHPSVAGFLTHCGWNSIFESISLGVPLIAYPQFAEQDLNCRMIVDHLRVGLELRKHENALIIGREEVEGVVKLLMEGEEGSEVKKNTAHAKDIIRRSVKKGGSSFENVQTFVRELLIQHSGCKFQT
ncbi:hypothetical protein O6H91_21G051000 [Diphasiastrum complanatum]|uniref:Uncharacterized protein n=1 Tax=Diphasiastrum complanatum TaxID=34168 RepID=A0ACC2AKC9_DIPCM|nr:hypothetical protein O6H91_21G051000 [Diphasiastrum complanatum]